MYRGMKSIKPYNSKILFPAHLLKCTCWCQSRVYEVDEQLGAIPKHPEAPLWPSEVVTLGLLHALKGVGNRPFYRWLTRDSRP